MENNNTQSKQVSSHTPGEIRNEYVDDDNYTHIDVWLTVAIVCNDTHKVFFIDNMYRTNEKVNASIEEVLISAPSTLTLKAENEKLKELLKMIFGEYLIDKNISMNLYTEYLSKYQPLNK